MPEILRLFSFFVLILCVRNYSASLLAQDLLVDKFALRPANGAHKVELGKFNFSSQEFLQLASKERFTYINPTSSENNKNLYSQNMALVLFATVTRGNTQAISFEKSTLAPYAPEYVPGSSASWYVGDRLFFVDNSAFFGIEFDSSFAYKNGVVRIGDSSEKAIVFLVSLNPDKK